MSRESNEDIRTDNINTGAGKDGMTRTQRDDLEELFYSLKLDGPDGIARFTRLADDAAVDAAAETERKEAADAAAEPERREAADVAAEPERKEAADHAAELFTGRSSEEQDELSPDAGADEPEHTESISDRMTEEDSCGGEPAGQETAGEEDTGVTLAGRENGGQEESLPENDGSETAGENQEEEETVSEGTSGTEAERADTDEDEMIGTETVGDEAGEEADGTAAFAPDGEIPEEEKRRSVRKKADKAKQRPVRTGKKSGRHSAVLVPAVIIIVAAIVASAALLGHRSASQNTDENSSADSTSETSQEAALEENAYPAVNELMRTYFDAYADGDTDTIASISSGLSETEKIQIRAVSEYIDSYPQIDVYTKPGPADGSYICFVVTEMKFEDQDTLIPGMQTMYVCTNDQGSLYINEDESDSDAAAYIKQVSEESDVVDLSNRVQEEYNSLMADNPDLKSYIDDTYNQIQVAVAEALGNAEASETSGDSTSGTSDTSASGVTALKANDVVNVRASASEDADVLGQTVSGDTYTLIEEQDDGWSQIEFDGQTGYVKTEYFTEVTSDSSESSDVSGSTSSGESSSEAASAGDTSGGGSQDSTGTETNQDTQSADTVQGTAMATESLIIRKTADESGDKIGNVWAGFTVNVLEKGDTWTKIEQDGVTGYVKTQYLKFN